MQYSTVLSTFNLCCYCVLCFACFCLVKLVVVDSIRLIVSLFKR
jgi:hypothetical protein